MANLVVFNQLSNFQLIISIILLLFSTILLLSKLFFVSVECDLPDRLRNNSIFLIDQINERCINDLEENGNLLKDQLKQRQIYYLNSRTLFYFMFSWAFSYLLLSYGWKIRSPRIRRKFKNKAINNRFNIFEEDDNYIVNFFQIVIHDSKYSYLTYYLYLFASYLVTIIQILSIHKDLDRKFFSLGLEWLLNNPTTLFIRKINCSLNIDQFNNLTNKNLITECSLNLNILLEFIYLVIWFFSLCLLILNTKCLIHLIKLTFLKGFRIERVQELLPLADERLINYFTDNLSQFFQLEIFREKMGIQRFRNLANLVIERYYTEGTSIESNQEEMEFKNEIKNELKNEMKNQLKNELRNELKNEIENELKNELKNEIENELKNETKNQLKTELKDDIRNELKDDKKTDKDKQNKLSRYF